MKAKPADNKNHSYDCKIKGCGKPSRSKTAGVCEMQSFWRPNKEAEAKGNERLRLFVCCKGYT